MQPYTIEHRLPESPDPANPTKESTVCQRRIVTCVQITYGEGVTSCFCDAGCSSQRTNCGNWAFSGSSECEDANGPSGLVARYNNS
jgi:hypothetical protein